MHLVAIFDGCVYVAGRIRHAINNHENRNGLINQRYKAFVFEVMLYKCETDNLWMRMKFSAIECLLPVGFR